MVIVRIKVFRSVCRLEYWGDRDRNCFFRSNPVILVEDSKHSATCPNSMPTSTFLQGLVLYKPVEKQYSYFESLTSLTSKDNMYID